jgi:hypothetical protein
MAWQNTFVYKGEPKKEIDNMPKFLIELRYND